MAALDKKADLAGPGIGTYEMVESVLPNDYVRSRTPREGRWPSRP